MVERCETISYSTKALRRIFDLVNGKQSRNVIIIILLLIPLLGFGFSKPATEFSVWIVNSDSHDVNTDMAVRTLLGEIASTKLNIMETTLDRLELVPLQVDVLVLVGHGQAEGLETSKVLIPWSELYDDISERQPLKTIVLACNSPSDPSSNIIGFASRVDAEAGAIIVGWHIQQAVTEQSTLEFPFDRVAQAQKRMQYPMGRYLYFVHGYYGFDYEFDKMFNNFTSRGLFLYDYDFDNVKRFDYFEHYDATEIPEMDFVHQTQSITDFANNFYGELFNIPANSQVNIIAHSMGGIIVREMLRLYRTQFDNRGINFGKVITLGTPHDGTLLADPQNPWSSLYAYIGGLLFAGEYWPSPVFHSMAPDSSLLTALNANPSEYSSGTDWYTISGYDAILSAVLYGIHNDFSDPIVAKGRAHLSFATDTHDFDVSHNVLIDDDSKTTFDKVYGWITSGVDSDGDGISDDAETYFHGTDPNDSNTDNDAISDGNEILWGYDPLDGSDPIPASSLVSSVSYTSSTMNVRVYVNHFTNMDYVKFYVKYYISGSWTGYYYKGTDYTPSSGKYYDSWTHPSGYTKMTIKVKAYDSYGHYLGCDYYTLSISSGGGGGGGGRPPLD